MELRVIPAAAPIALHITNRIVENQSGLFGWSEGIWVSIAAFASTSAAGATLWLAFITRRLAEATAVLSAKTADMVTQTAAVAKETRDLVARSDAQQAQIERHHQQSLMPFAAVSGKCHRDLTDIHFSGELRNEGTGIALSVTVYIVPDDEPTGAFSISPVAPGTVCYFNIKWTSQSLTPKSAIPYHCLVTFTTLFGTVGAVEMESKAVPNRGVEIVRMMLPGDPANIKDKLKEYASTPPIFATGTVTTERPERMPHNDYISRGSATIQE